MSEQPKSEREPDGYRWRFHVGKDRSWRYCETDPHGDGLVVELEPLFLARSIPSGAEPADDLALWLTEREQNARAIADTKTGADRDGWLEDARYFRAAAVLAERPSGAELPALTDAARDVLAERERQQSVEGWTPEHDDDHHTCDLAAAAACYAAGTVTLTYASGCLVWPDDWHWKAAPQRRNLVKAGALILAEIERMDRAILAASSGKASETDASGRKFG